MALHHTSVRVALLKDLVSRHPGLGGGLDKEPDSNIVDNLLNNVSKQILFKALCRQPLDRGWPSPAFEDQGWFH